MRGLYAIVDVEAVGQRGLDPIAFADAVLAAQPAALQLRAKLASARETLGLLRELAPMCHRAGVPLVANDRPDLAILAGCDLVHVGQDDMPIDRVRRIARGLGVGVSTHTLGQLDKALAARPDYVAFGPVFETATKKDSEAVVGVMSLPTAYARAHAEGVPLVAIGGITHERARSLAQVVDAVAVIAALIPPKLPFHPLAAVSDVLREVTERARALKELFSPAPVLAEAMR